jgi:catechol 2,3-dioxygenase
LNKIEIATFGAVHLNVTDINNSLKFWQEIVGLKVRSQAEVIELGTDDETLVVIHPGAKMPFLAGYSGIYHLAIHFPTEPEFARVLARLISKRWPISPTDHIMHKAIYLEDPDGITVELAFETPERFKSYDFANGRFGVIDSEGRMRGGTEPLDVEEVLAKLPDQDFSKPVPVGTKIGHMHLYVGDLQKAYEFYQSLGFEGNLFNEKFQFADLGAGGIFKHRIAVNTWQGMNAQQAPKGTAGMEYFVVRYAEKAKLDQVLNLHPEAEKMESGYLLRDPAENAVVLCY